MNFFLLLQIAIKGDLSHRTGKAGLWHGAAISKRTDSTVDTCMKACDAVIAALQRQDIIGVADLAEEALTTAKADKDHTQTRLCPA
jgi:hypothetical protein